MEIAETMYGHTGLGSQYTMTLQYVCVGRVINIMAVAFVTLKIFYFLRCQRIDDRKEETVSSSPPFPPTIAPLPAAISSAAATFNHVTPVHFQQPTHLLAAIALSELAATSMKRCKCLLLMR